MEQEENKLLLDEYALINLFKTEELFRIDKDSTTRTADIDLKTVAKVPLSFSGDNKNQLMFVFEETNIFQHAWWEMVKGLITNQKALNLKIEQVSILSLQDNKGLTFENLIQGCQAQRLVFWGHFPTEWGLALNPYELSTIGNHQLILCDHPEKIVADPQLKLKLWQPIKQNWI